MSGKDLAQYNLAALMGDPEYTERKDILMEIIRCFNEKKVRWAVGCSLNLFLRGIVDDFHDLDLIVYSEDIPAIMEIMESLGATMVDNGGKGLFQSDHYMHYQLGRVDVDIISGFRVVGYVSSYYYDWRPEEVDWQNVTVTSVEEIQIPMIFLEAMYILYYMMEECGQRKRHFKRELIEKQLKLEKLAHREILDEALSKRNALPATIRMALTKLLKADAKS